MIRVNIYRNEKKDYVGFTAHGHAGFREAGQDIVCAAASILMINTINAIEKFATDKTSLVTDDDEGLIEFKLLDAPSTETALLLKTMILGLRGMADDNNYEKYIEIKIKEV